MKKIVLHKIAVLLMLFLSASAGTAQTVYKVVPDGLKQGEQLAGNIWQARNDQGEWVPDNQVVKFSEALAKAKAGDEIWLLGGWQLTHPGEMYIAPKEGWKLPSGVKLYGGFGGQETSADQRATQGLSYNFVNRSVMSGDIKQDDRVNSEELIFPDNPTRTDNAKHILVLDAGVTNNNGRLRTVVNGITFRGGNATGDEVKGGGAIYVHSETAECVPYAIERCFLVNNYGKQGGAIYVDASVKEVSSASFINQCVLFNNVAGEESTLRNSGGGVYLAGAGKLINSAIVNNVNGGVVLSNDAYMVNCTSAHNSSSGVDMTDAPLDENTHVVNSIMWGNSFPFTDGKQVRMAYSAYPGAASDDMHNLDISRENVGDAISPMFESSSAQSSFDLDFNWRYNAYPVWSWKLQEESFLIGKGNDAMYSNHAQGDKGVIQTDLAGMKRIDHGIDMGAYEFQSMPAERIRYVKKNNTSGKQDGKSWETAYSEVQKAINDLANDKGLPGEVWIAAGTYEPTEFLDEDKTLKSFRMRDGISVYGGFAGTETTKAERKKNSEKPWDFAAKTILQGVNYKDNTKWDEQNESWNVASDSRHVVWFAPRPGEPAFQMTTLLEGVTVQGGQATVHSLLRAGNSEHSYKEDCGAGVYLAGRRCYLHYSVVRNNFANADGGGVFLEEGRIRGCLLYNNTGMKKGGGVYVNRSGLVLRSMVTNNSANEGGGVYLDNNGVQPDGMNHPEYQLLSTTVVTNNTSVANGAVYCNKGGVVLHSLIAKNYTSTATDFTMEVVSRTGGLYINEFGKVFNTVLWGNEIVGRKVQLFAMNPSAQNVVFYNSAIANMNNILWNNTFQQDMLELSEHNFSEKENEVNPGFVAEGLPETCGVISEAKEITYFWEPIQGSNLRGRGIQMLALPKEILLLPELDLNGKHFEQKPAIGPYRIEKTPLKPEKTNEHIRLYVDVDCTVESHNGSHWRTASRALNEAIMHFASLTAEEVGDRRMEILVAEGNIWPRYAAVNEDPKTASLIVRPMPAGKTLYIKGGFSRKDTTQNDPFVYRSQINGNHRGKDFSESLYHTVLVMQDAKVEFEGFHVINGNASAGSSVKAGGGMLVRKDAEATLRNCIFENNRGNENAAVDAREATLKMYNCVLNNNQNLDNGKTILNARNLYANHVTVVHNVGRLPAVGGNVTIENTYAVGNKDVDGTTGREAGNTHVFAVDMTTFVNPTKNVGATLGYDTYLGGYTSFMPTTQCEVVNEGKATDLTTDITGQTRSRGGAPDLGAYEALLPEDGTVVYVREGGTGDGSTWDQAMGSVSAALDKAKPGMQVWVAAGTYIETLNMKEGVHVYGGFAKTGNPDNVLDGKNRMVTNDNPDFKTTIDANKQGRVLTQSKHFTTETVWEGLVLRNGRIDRTASRAPSGNNGGAGVLLCSQGTLKNCVIEESVYEQTDHNQYKTCGGGGLRLEGSGVVESCIIRKNRIVADGTKGYACGGGLFITNNGGMPSLINSIIVENEVINKRDYEPDKAAQSSIILGASVHIRGNGIKFYNCTFAYNSANSEAKKIDGSSMSNPVTGGVWDSGYNCDNPDNTGSSFYNCIFWGNYGIGSTEESSYQVGTSGYLKGEGFNPKLYNCYVVATSEKMVTTKSGVSIWNNKEECLQMSDYAGQRNGTEFYKACRANAPFDNETYKLKTSGNGLYCINKGTDEGLDDIFLDAAGYDRIQYCTVDKGAYENREAITILSDADNVYYVTPAGRGLANGSSLANAACAQELQMVLHAAGVKAKQEAAKADGKPVVVKLAGDPAFVYRPTEMTDELDPKSYSFVIPYGVTVKGGYLESEENWGDDNPAARNAFTNRSILSAVAQVRGTNINGYHVLTFAEKPQDWTAGDAKTTVDGLYLVEGAATAMIAGNKPTTRGGGAEVPAWGHISNCVVANCEAKYGGALYLLPGATVTGTAMRFNKAEYGGAVYADATNVSADLRSHMISVTITDNTATASGGGIYMEDGAVMVGNSTFWGNEAPSDKNVSGVVTLQFQDNKFSSILPAEKEFFPFNDCFIETYKVPSDEGMKNESMESDYTLYFKEDRTLKAYSALIKSGALDKYQKEFEKVFDIAPCDMKNEARIEAGHGKVDVGAFAFSGGKLPEPQTDADVFYHIFVSHGMNKDVEGEVQTYLGKSFYTAITWLDDALEYIQKVRTNTKLSADAKNKDFYIYLAQGTYRPNIQRLNEGEVLYDQRQCSFVIPSGVHLYGGFVGDEAFGCGITSLIYKENNETKTIALQDVTAANQQQTLVNSRKYDDLNHNGIEEPWEFKNQTILTGDLNVAATMKNAYHVLFSTVKNTHFNSNAEGAYVLLDGITVKDGEGYPVLSPPDQFNESGRGGALYANGIEYKFNGCRVMNCVALRGGAVYSRNADVTIIGSSFTGNSTVLKQEDEKNVNVRGGAVFLSGYSSGKNIKLKVVNSLFANNESDGEGGAIATSNDWSYGTATLDVVNSLIVRNKAKKGSAIYAPAKKDGGSVGKITNTVLWGGEGEGVVSDGLQITYSASDVKLEGEGNVLLNAENMAVDGPKFERPTERAGVIHSNFVSRWNPIAVSLLADAGNGSIPYGQETPQGAYENWWNTTGETKRYFPETSYKRYSGPLQPTDVHESTYIDIGLYEYQYKNRFGSMEMVYVDVQDRGKADGTSWSNATSDLRGAIAGMCQPEGGNGEKKIYVHGGDYQQTKLFNNDAAYLINMDGKSSILQSLSIYGSCIGSSNEQGEQQDYSKPSVLSVHSEVPVGQMISANTNGLKLTLDGFTVTGVQKGDTEWHNGVAVDIANKAKGQNVGQVFLNHMAFRKNDTGLKVSNEGGASTLIANTLFADGRNGLVVNGEASRTRVLNNTLANLTESGISGDASAEVANTVYWKVTGAAPTDKAMGNHNLGQAANGNIYEGPNFVDPDNGNYMIRPGMLLMDHANEEKYLQWMGAGSLDPIYKDLGNNVRQTHVLDVGAYECNAPLQQIVFVKTNVTQTDQSGKDWHNPITDLQSAIDLVAVYADKNQNEPGDKKNGYVFVHRDVHYPQSVMQAVPNVKVYGGMNDEAGTTPSELIANRKSVLADEMSTINGLTLKAQDGLFDGFKFTDNVEISNGMVSTSVLEAKTSIVNPGILYNSFVRNELNGKGTVVNITTPVPVSPDITKINVEENAAENGYVTADVWKYQLKESSASINDASASDIQQYMNMAGHERDLSGMPRVRDGVDNGCFETWNILEDFRLTKDAMPTDRHVVYVRAGKELSVEKGAFPTGSFFNPGFLLLEHGAGFRSNANSVHLTNFAVERNLNEGNHRWDLVYLPFDIERTVTTPESGEAQVVAKTYNGNRRAQFDYQFSATDGAWEETSIKGKTGMLLRATSNAKVRMYGKEYSESIDNPQTISLPQHNHIEPWQDGSGSSSQKFTHLENMGWNMFGSPYLCALHDGDMEYGRMIYEKSGDTFAPRNTVDGTSCIGAGSAVLTQTATLKTAETVLVRQRVDDGQTQAVTASRLRVALAPAGEDLHDELLLNAVPTDEAKPDFDMSADGVKMMTVGKAAQMYLERNGKQYALLSALDRSGKVDVGVYAPRAGNYSIFIPQDTETDGYDVVLLQDKSNGRAVDLLEGAYEFAVQDTTCCHSRFTLSFIRTDSEDAARRIYVHTLGNGRVRIGGLQAGDRITAYQENGVKVAYMEAHSIEEMLTLPGKIAVIVVNGAADSEVVKKVLLR